MGTLYRIALLITLLLSSIGVSRLTSQDVNVTRIATGLNNPRGIAVLPDGRLLVAEAGTGLEVNDPSLNSGRMSIFDDLNQDGDFDDTNEITPILSQLFSYNALTIFGTRSDEVGGTGDIIYRDDGTIFFTKDDPRQGYAADGNSSDIGVAEFNINSPTVNTFIRRFSTLNALAYDENTDILYVAESGLNRLLAVDSTGEIRTVAIFHNLAHGQQAVPAGLALDTRTGDVLVALFSGGILDYFGELLTFMPGDAKVVRVDPATGAQSDEIVNLTTATDVAIDEAGNIYVVEFTTTWPPVPMPDEFDLYDPNALPDPGSYARFTGRVTMYPTHNAEPVILASGLDTPTNITYHQGTLYVSGGQGTPGRPVIAPQGVTRITGEIYEITGFVQ